MIAWALGAYAQTRYRYTAALEERAAHLEREREQLELEPRAGQATAVHRREHHLVLQRAKQH